MTTNHFNAQHKIAIKFCGIMDSHTAAFCESHHVDAIGVVFAKSKRQVTLEQALAIKAVLNQTALIAVFKDQSPDVVSLIVHQLMPTAIQVYDDAEYFLPPGIGIIRAMTPRAFEQHQPEETATPFSGVLIDHPAPGSGQVWDWTAFGDDKQPLLAGGTLPLWIAGGLTPDNVIACIQATQPFGVDVSSGIETDGVKDPQKMLQFIKQVRQSITYQEPDAAGYFGGLQGFGGQYMPETLAAPLAAVKGAFQEAQTDPGFQAQLATDRKDYIGRETPLYFAQRLSEHLGINLYLKREDLCHTGAHKINNAMGQGRLAAKMGFKHLIAETGAGQHGIATATVAAKLGMTCTVFMGATDVVRQASNVDRMKRLGAKVVSVTKGTGVLKDATSQALRHWVSNPDTCFYVIGSAIGPAPYPEMVRYFQSVIGKEARQQIQEKTGALPDEVVAAVGGGSNAIGIFTAFIDDGHVALTGVEAGGLGIHTSHHAATLTLGRVGVFHGTKMHLLQDPYGNILNTHSISAGLDYSGVGPEHCHLKTLGRAQYYPVNDAQVLEAFNLTTALEGIIPALESAHALAFVMQHRKDSGKTIIVNLSGRGDKDLHTVSQQELDPKEVAHAI